MNGKQKLKPSESKGNCGWSLNTLDLLHHPPQNVLPVLVSALTSFAFNEL